MMEFLRHREVAPVENENGSWGLTIRSTEDVHNTNGHSNKISTTKYTLLTWLPISLMEQFRRIANVYFIFISILMIIGTYATWLFQSPLNPWSTVATLVFVLMVTSIKEGYEDYQRSCTDKEENIKKVIIVKYDTITHTFVEMETQTQYIKAGDIIKLVGKSSVPADLLLIQTSNYTDGNQCYIETANIDGETNLKLREAPAALLPLAKIGILTKGLCTGSIEFEPPNKNIHNFNGLLKLDEIEEPIALGADNILLRSSLFSNTDWCYGIAIYTGQESKIQMNNRKAESKMSKVEEYLNRAIVLIFIAQCILVSFSVGSVYILGYDDYNRLPYVYLNNSNSTSILPLWLENWFVFLLLFNNFIPISLYVTIEMVNLGQSFMISSDIHIYDDILDMPCTVRSSNLSQELGMVGHIFSDKTGTLTRNEMKFVKFVVDGVMYTVPHPPAAASPILPSTVMSPSKSNNNNGSSSRNSDIYHHNSNKMIDNDGNIIITPTTNANNNTNNNNAGIVVNDPKLHIQQQQLLNAQIEQHRQQVFQNMKKSKSIRNNTNNNKIKDNTNTTSTPTTTTATNDDDDDYDKDSTMYQFLLCLTTCHTVVRESDGTYRAESPDELALVQGVEPFDCGIDQRGTTSMTINMLNERVTMDVLAVNSFNADRKRMSILLRKLKKNIHPSNNNNGGNNINNNSGNNNNNTNGNNNDDDYEYIVMCKGADNIILPLCQLDKNERKHFDKSLLDLAVMGLRTLCVAQKKLDTQTALAWRAKYLSAAASLQDRAEKLSAVAAELEQDMKLLGITAIEDRLQDEVPEVIADLAKAGIILWMLTGDKEETAVNIGRSCNLLLPDTKLFFLSKITSADNYTHRLRQVYEDIQSHNGNTSSSSRSNSNNASNSYNTNDNTKSIAMLGKLYYDDEDETNNSNNSSNNNNSSSSSSNDNNNSNNNSSSSSSSFSSNDNDIINKHRLFQPVGKEIALVMDGPSFKHFDENNLSHRKCLLRIGQASRSVIACRLTPVQKQQLVALMKKDSNPRVTCLSIGDGANDVSMIREADVGVGIFGKEGRQAANNADFAIGQFKFLKKLMIVHGRFNYSRQCRVFLYSMHKNIVITITLFWYNYYAAMSGTSMYDSWVYTGYNFILGLPIIFYGIMNCDISARFAMNHPLVYSTGRENVYLSISSICGWVLNSLIYSMVICLLYFYVSPDSFSTQSLYVMGTTIFTGTCMAMQAKVAFLHSGWNWIQIMAMMISVLGMILFFYVLNILVYADYVFYGVATELYVTGFYWLFGFFTIMIFAVLIDISFYYTILFFWPTQEMLYAEYAHQEDDDNIRVHGQGLTPLLDKQVYSYDNSPGGTTTTTIGVEIKPSSSSSSVFARNSFVSMRSIYPEGQLINNDNNSNNNSSSLQIRGPHHIAHGDAADVIQVVGTNPLQQKL